ncbi:TlpA disulfide reductase family protein [Aureivirga sp. CE67]|uniref:TlpA disulfide reductase family protein n=1 Tax=Aureivirga sp. CE67 TaxID=1788983 RepID=UPI0018CB8854|nr:TlpA disulfide reductase family protein [Aureivirga sp. CE67]
MKKLLLYVLLSIVIVSCNENNSKKNPKGKEYSISVELKNAEAKDSTIIYLEENELKIDSTYIIDGKFNFSGKFDSEPKYLKISSGNRGRFSIENINANTKFSDFFISKYILVGNENVTIKSNLDNFEYSTNVTGSEFHKNMSDYQKIMNPYDKIIDSLTFKWKFLPVYDPLAYDTLKNSIWNEIDNLRAEREVKNLNYIKNNTDNYYAMIRLGYIKEDFSKDLLNDIYKQFPEEIKESEHAIKIRNYLNFDLLEIGNDYADFEAKDNFGKKVKFSDLVQQKYTLLKFTAANCGPCKKSIPEMKKLNSEYSDILKMISFSVDSDKKVWKNRIKKDSITWLSLWDGKGRKSEVLVKYQITGYPTYVLIDDNEKIIDKWIGYSDGMLKRRLGKYLN